MAAIETKKIEKEIIDITKWYFGKNITNIVKEDQFVVVVKELGYDCSKGYQMCGSTTNTYHYVYRYNDEYFLGSETNSIIHYVSRVIPHGERYYDEKGKYYGHSNEHY